MKKNNYHSILDAILDLQARGFFLDFGLVGNKLFCAQEKCYLTAEEFDILEIYHFPNYQPTCTNTVIYAIEALSGSLRGILFDSGNKRNAPASSIISRKIKFNTPFHHRVFVSACSPLGLIAAKTPG